MSGMGDEARERAIDLPETNSTRLDNASAVIGKMNEREKAGSKRIDEGLAEIEKVKMQISDLSSQMIGQVPDVGGLHEEIEKLTDSYANAWLGNGVERQKLVDLRSVEQDAKDTLSLLDGNAALDIGLEMGDDNKPVYKTVQFRSAATAKQLSQDEEYQAAKLVLRKASIAVDKVKAILTTNEEMTKEYGRRNASLISRLDNLTAQLNAIK